MFEFSPRHGGHYFNRCGAQRLTYSVVYKAIILTVTSRTRLAPFATKPTLDDEILRK